MIRFILKPFVRPFVRKKLDALYVYQNQLTICIERQRKAKRRVSDLYAEAHRVNERIMKLERWAE